jgi:hypothetical protein
MITTRSILVYATVLVFLTACIVAPALADVKYTGGSPDLSAYVSGLNEFTAGSDITIPVVLENTGLNHYVQVDENIVAPDDLPDTAKFVTANLSAGDAPIVIKSDPQMIGDIQGQATETVVFNATINADAPAGTYMLPLDVSYATLSSVDEYAAEPTARNYYQQNNVTLMVPLVIKAEVIPQVISSTPDNLIAGAEGYVILTLKNIGSLDGAKTTVSILQDGGSPIAPVDDRVYIGDFPVGGIVTCRYEVAVNKTAIAKSYPIDVLVTYQDNEGDFVDSPAETAGVNVESKVNFTVVSPTIIVNPGSRNTIQVEYKNTGDTAVKSAWARIDEVIPFTSLDDVVYLGDLAPGESAIASYQISVSGDAIPKIYGLDSEIRYSDSLNDTYVTDPMKVSVDVEDLTGIGGVLSNTFSLTLIIAALAVLIYAILHFRKKKR